MIEDTFHSKIVLPTLCLQLTQMQVSIVGAGIVIVVMVFTVVVDLVSSITFSMRCCLHPNLRLNS